MKILVLGHKGMLGSIVKKYFEKQEGYSVLIVESRWGDLSFWDEVLKNKPDYIINCIGVIPQKKPKEEEYAFVNIELPKFLESLEIRTIHPSTDCEFAGTLPVSQTYTKTSSRDATDVYGKSKADISEIIERNFHNTKIIRTSIIGHEEGTHYALLDWFLSQTKEANGFTNHFWNGVTTLEWAKLAKNLIENWEETPILNQYATKPDSKYNLLQKIKKIYSKDILIHEFQTETTVNKCLLSDTELPGIEDQLRDLKDFLNK